MCYFMTLLGWSIAWKPVLINPAISQRCNFADSTPNSRFGAPPESDSCCYLLFTGHVLAQVGSDLLSTGLSKVDFTAFWPNLPQWLSAVASALLHAVREDISLLDIANLVIVTRGKHATSVATKQPHMGGMIEWDNYLLETLH